MTVVVTQQQVQSDFTQSIPADVKAVLLPHIIGPQAILHRYSVAAEKSTANLGQYIPGSNTTYTWPNRNPLSVIDLTYTALFIDDALLRYYQHLSGGGGFTVTQVNGQANQIITTATDGFKTNGGSYPRNPVLGDRDVQIGDVIHLNYSSVDFYSTVSALIPTYGATVISAATSDAGNATTQGASTVTTQIAGTSNDVVLTGTGSSYNGYASGYLNETYTVTVTQSSTGGDATTARITVTSASGTDNQGTPFAPAAFSSPTNIGTRGLTATFTHTADNIVVGQTWTIVEGEAFTTPVPTSGGSYTGTVNQTYIVKVTTGGKYADPTQPQISVTSSLGIDSSGPTTVTAAASAVAIGTQGATIKFSQAGLRLGDIYYVVVTGPVAQAYKTIATQTNLPASFSAAADMTLELCIQKNIVVPSPATAPNYNWTDNQSGITVNSGMQFGDPTLTNGGVLFTVPVVSGPSTLMYSQYREWDPTHVNRVVTVQVSDPTTISTYLPPIAGTITPDNPMGYALSKALLNSNGQPINFSTIADPTSYGDWGTLLNVLVGLPINTIVPLSADYTVHSMVKTHVDVNSADILGTWRTAWLPLVANTSTDIVDQAHSSDGNVVLATLAANPNIVATQYTYLTVTSGNSLFVTRGVVPGDIVRYQYGVDGFGNTTYVSYVVSTVVNENTLILVTGNSGAISTPQRVEVWRNYTTGQVAAAMAAQCMSYADDRIRYVFPDQIDAIEGLVQGYFLCAALAGFTSGIASQQGITGIPFQGFTGASRSTTYLNNGDLNTLATAGAFIVTADGSGNVLTRNALTTDQSSVANAYETIVRNDDAVRHCVYNSISPFFDIIHLTSGGLQLIQGTANQELFEIQSKTYTATTQAAMIVDWTVTSVRAGVVATECVLQVSITRPYPCEQLDLTLIFS